MVDGANGLGLPVAEVVTEVGSGLNGRRRKLHRVLSDPQAAVIVVEHRDRLARFGVEHLEAVLSASGRRLVVLDPTETADGLVRDITEHHRVANLREDALHQLTTSVAAEYGTVVVEGLNVAGTLRNRRLARRIADAGFGEIRRQLDYKTRQRHATRLVAANRWYPSSN